MMFAKKLLAVASVVVIVLLLSVWGTHAWKAHLTEVQMLKAERHLLKVQLFSERVAQVQRDLQKSETELKAERTALEAEFRRSLRPDAKAVFNWQTRTFEVPAASTPEDADKRDDGS